jgi:hypothetical protein
MNLVNVSISAAAPVAAGAGGNNAFSLGKIISTFRPHMSNAARIYHWLAHAILASVA